MKHIILASHHRFAAGLADTLAFIGGEELVARVHTICAYVDETPLADTIAEVFEMLQVGAQDQVLIVTDMLEGSVNQAFLPYLSKNVFLVTGANVVACLALLLDEQPWTLQTIEDVLSGARASMKLVNTLSLDDDNDDE